MLSVEVEKEFGFDEQPKTVGAGGKCPGEDNCTDFAKTKGTHAEREIDVCTGGNPQKPTCSKFPTKPKPQSAHEAPKGAARIAENVRRFRQNRLSGFAPGKDELSPIEYQCLLFLDSLIERAERRNSVLQRIYLEQNLQQMTQILSLSVKPK